MTIGPEPISLRPIPRTGETLPVVGLGSWRAFDVPSPPEGALAEVLGRFVSGGARLVDTSPMYGRAEGVIGTIASEASLTTALFFATKVWTSGRRAGEDQMEQSAKRLGVPAIDLIQVHNLLDVETHLATLEAWKAEGRVRFVGVTHYLETAFPALERLLDARSLDFVQFNYSLGERGAERSLLSRAAHRGTAVIANRPFGSGDLLAATRAKPLPEWAVEIGCRNWAQFLLKYVVSHPAVTCTIPATGKPEHMLDNLAAGRPPFPDEATRSRMAAHFDRVRTT